MKLVINFTPEALAVASRIGAPADLPTAGFALMHAGDFVLLKGTNGEATFIVSRRTFDFSAEEVAVVFTLQAFS